MEMSTSSIASEPPLPTPTSNPAAGEFDAADNKPAKRAQDPLAVDHTKAPGHSEPKKEKDQNNDCPGDVLDAWGERVQYGTNLYYEAGEYMMLSKNTPQQRRKQARLRLAQSKAYSEIIEERLVLLEKSVADLQPQGRKTLAQDDDEDEVAPQSHASISVMGWIEFRPTVFMGPTTRAHRPEVDPARKCMIEILRDEPGYSNISFSDDRGPHLLGLRGENPVPRQTTESIASPVNLELHQIRIRSKLLLQVLQEITGCSTAHGRWKHKVVFLRPFKLLVHCVQNLKDRLRHLEGLHAADKAHGDSEHGKTKPGQAPEIVVQPKEEEFGPVRETESIEARNQLKVLCEMVDTYLEPQILLHQALDADTPKVGFHELWYIFKPGCEIRTRDATEVQLYRVLNVTGGRISSRTRSRDGNPDPYAVASRKLEDQGYSPGSFLIECFYIHYDGVRYGPVNATFQIRKFDGRKPVTSLPIFPLDCDKNKENIRDTLLKRGEEFASLSNAKAASHRKYRGLTLDKTPELVESEIIVDFQLAFLLLKGSKPTIGLDDLLLDDPLEYNPTWNDGPEDLSFITGSKCLEEGCCGNDISHRDYNVDAKARKAFRDSKPYLLESVDNPDQLTSEHKMLLPPCVYGFVLRTRKWATFSIDLIRPPEYASGWDQLVINKETKNTVLALVNNHERPRDSVGSELSGVLSSVDLVQGKGKGLIILLHGEPGVGKTSTAECVAAHTQRPLFPITCGDIGHLAEDVEANLEQNFQLAHKWGCVLLLDEADIFLSTRTGDDIERNAIVSVFLRTLEYYSGILFLTTNRVGKIDAAFKSRIHLSLYYRRLNKERTLKIWDNNLRRVKGDFLKEDKDIVFQKGDIMQFAEDHYDGLKRSKTLGVWNGRQIRNSFQTAIAIATYEAREKTQNKPKREDGTDHAVSLEVAHFKKVAKSAKQFDRYLIGLNSGANEAQLAKEHALRYDDFADSESDRDRSDKELSRERYWKRKSSKRDRRDEASSESSSGEESSSSSASDTSQRKKKKRKRV